MVDVINYLFVIRLDQNGDIIIMYTMDCRLEIIIVIVVSHQTYIFKTFGFVFTSRHFTVNTERPTEQRVYSTEPGTSYRGGFAWIILMFTWPFCVDCWSNTTFTLWYCHYLTLRAHTLLLGNLFWQQGFFAEGFRDDDTIYARMRLATTIVAS